MNEWNCLGLGGLEEFIQPKVEAVLEDISAGGELQASVANLRSLTFAYVAT